MGVLPSIKESPFGRTLKNRVDNQSAWILLALTIMVNFMFAWAALNESPPHHDLNGSISPPGYGSSYHLR